MYRKLTTFSSILVTVVLSVMIVAAQTNCEALLEEALIALEDNCETTGRNEACYGFNRVEASFLSDITETTFVQPSDIAPVADLETLRTSPLSVDNSTWGVAIMNLQANLPNTLPGQVVTFVLMGDVEVENAVDPATAFNPSDGIEVTITFAQGAAPRSGPGDNYNTVGAVPVGTNFIADGLSEDEAWLRVIYQNRPAWVRRSTVDPIPEIDTLAILTPDLNTPMQAFYLRTGIGQPTCNEVPDNSLLVQGPEDIQINLTVNGANIELGSSGVLRVIQDASGQPLLEITVLDGQFVVKADDFTSEDIVIRAGYRTTLCLDPDNNLGSDGEANDLTVSCGASIPELINTDTFNDGLCNLETIPINVLNYALNTCYETHTVVSGENLFRIAQFYCVTVDEIATVNNLDNTRLITVGQQLVIPLNACDGVGSTRPPVTTNPPTTTDDTPVTVNLGCETFTVPQQTVIASNFVIDWADVEGADNYVVAVFNEAGEEYLTIPVTDSQLVTNGGSWSSSGYIDVRAYNGGEYLCYARMDYQRLANPNEQLNTEDFSFTVSCVASLLTYTSTVTVNYSGAENGETVTLDIEDNNSIPFYIDVDSNLGDSGQLAASIPYAGSIKITVSRPATGEEFVRTCFTMY